LASRRLHIDLELPGLNLDGLLTERKSDVDGGEMVRLPVLLLGIVDGAIIFGGCHRQFVR
jgi:hypothetical protein